MTGSVNQAHAALPRTDDVRAPARPVMHGLRPAFAAVARRRWSMLVLGAERVPANGPLVFAGNHIGLLDGPMMAILGPRPVHALTKREMFSGPLGAFLRAAGQIPVNRFEVDPRAIRTAIRTLREGRAVGVFPESTRGAGDMENVEGGAAYLALVTGAPVVPVAFLGTRAPGSTSTFPTPGSRVVMAYGDPIDVTRLEWPRRPEAVGALTEQIRHAVRSTVQVAEQLTGVRLPGPLPEAGPASSKDDRE